MQVPADVVILGDLVLDWYCDSNLPFLFSEMASSRFVWKRILELPGGSAANFARCAAEAGFHPLVIGKVGQDRAGEVLISALKRWGVMTAVARDPSSETGRAVLVWDGTGDVRLLVAGTPNANSLLTPQEVESQAEVIASARVLYLCGYCLLESPRREAMQRALDIARSAGHVLTVLDVVPRDLYRQLTFEKFREITGHIDILVAEAGVMRHFLGLAQRGERIDRTKVEQTLNHLKKYYQRFVLRFGPGECNEQAIVDGSRVIWEETGYGYAHEKRGYGDRLTVASLQKVFLA